MRISNVATTQVHVCLIQSLMIMRPIFCILKLLLFLVIAFLSRAWFGPTLWKIKEEGKIVSTHTSSFEFVYVHKCQLILAYFVTSWSDFVRSSVAPICFVLFQGWSHSLQLSLLWDPVTMFPLQFPVLEGFFDSVVIPFQSAVFFWGFFNIFSKSNKIVGGFFFLLSKLRIKSPFGYGFLSQQDS